MLEFCLAIGGQVSPVTQPGSKQFVGSIGGPIKKDRVLFFSHDETRIDASAAAQTRTVYSVIFNSAREVKGDILTLVTGYKDPKSGQNWLQMATTTRCLYEGGLTTVTVSKTTGTITNIPFIENFLPGLKDYYFPGYLRSIPRCFHASPIPVCSPLRVLARE